MKTLLVAPKPMRWFSTLLLAFFLFSASMGLQSCSPKYDLVAVENVAKLSSSLPALMEKATDQYANHETGVQKALADIGKARAHAEGTKKNTEIAQQWRIFQDDIAAPFFDKWKSKGKLDKDFIREAVKQVKGSLDAIEKAEKNKKKK